MHLQQATYEKFLNGDPISNYEIDQAVDFHNELANNLSKMGPMFHLAFKESNRVFLVMVEFQQARKRLKEARDVDHPAFKDGYQTGLTWDADWTPGGPHVYTASSKYVSGKLSPAQIQMEDESKEYHRLWLRGFAHGNAVDPNKKITKFLKRA